LRKEIKEAELQIANELESFDGKKFNSNIRKQHEAKFKYSNFFPTCESYLYSLNSYGRQLADKKSDEKANIDGIMSYLQAHWSNLTKNIEKINRISNGNISSESKENFERQLHQLSLWLMDIEYVSSNLNRVNFTSTAEYKQLLEKCKVSY
jgi:hypothetical protein